MKNRTFELQGKMAEHIKFL